MAASVLDPHLLVRLDSKAHLAPARFASVAEVRFIASETPVHSMRPRSCSLHEHGGMDSVRRHQPEANVQACTDSLSHAVGCVHQLEG